MFVPLSPMAMHANDCTTWTAGCVCFFLRASTQQERRQGQTWHGCREENGRSTLQQELGRFEHALERHLAAHVRFVRCFLRFAVVTCTCAYISTAIAICFISESFSVIMKKIWEALDSSARQWRTVFKVLIIYFIFFARGFFSTRMVPLINISYPGADFAGSSDQKRNGTCR